MKCSVTLLGCVCLLILMARLEAEGEGNHYPWLPEGEVVESIAQRVAPPAGFTRVVVAPGSFAHWLRYLPLKPAGSPVMLFNGERKHNQSAHHAVIAMDVGSRNLQQCADAVIRLRAEYLYSRERFEEIVFHFTSGHAVPFSRWIGGERPVVNGNRVTWKRTSGRDRSYPSFRKYLKILFVYAGSDSLSRELESRILEEMEIGDVFIHGGFPGHAVLVVDLARDARSGAKIFLLAQSYMPAQEIHVLRNPEDPTLSPWYRVPAGETLTTPEWTFSRKELRGFFSQTQPTEPPGTGSDSG